MLPQYRFRDFGYEHAEPSFRIQVAMNERQGIICFASLLGPYTGYYYGNFDTKTTTGFSVHPIFTTIPSADMSFIPHNLQQEKLQQQIDQLALRHYKGYRAFTPVESVYEVNSVNIEGLFYSSVQLFHLYFKAYLSGMI